MTTVSSARLGAIYTAGHCEFRVWAPAARRLTVQLLDPVEREIDLHRGSDGTHSVRLEDVPAGALYRYCLDGATRRPDPASRWQPEGVHGPSAVVDPAYAWTDGAFEACPLNQAVFYEAHIGTFTGAGTFRAAIDRLDDLATLGVTHVELMPVAAFPGARNWGYDGVYPFSVHHDYGGPAGLRQFVNACHERGLAVVLDVVYNHLGPEGNYLRDFGPYFTDRYKTPWGDALNFDGPGSDGVRRFFVESAEYFVRECHIDAFRLDAIHAIVDTSAIPFLREITEAIHRAGKQLGRDILVIGETDANDVRVVRSPEQGGLGMNGQWADDFHHAVHAFVTAERNGYYADFGNIEDVSNVFSSPYLFQGQYSRFRQRRHGSRCAGMSGEHFVVCTQNHDQIGNRALGDRLSAHLEFSQQKLLACLLLLSPYVPLLFMGQEYGETAPFQYFTSHGSSELAEAVRRGRRAEFADFGWQPDQIPDPQEEATFLRSKLDWNGRFNQVGSCLLRLHERLLALRREDPALASLSPDATHARVLEGDGGLVVKRNANGSSVLAVYAFDRPVSYEAPPSEKGWEVVLDSEAREFGGAASPPGESRGTDVTVSPWRCLLFRGGETG